MDIATRHLKDHLSEYLKRVQTGEEITINYNGAEDILDPVEFPVLD